MFTSYYSYFFFFSSRRRHTRSLRAWSSDVCSSDLRLARVAEPQVTRRDDVDRERVAACVEPARRPGPRAPHHPEDAVGREVVALDEREVRREVAEQRHDGRLALRLALGEEKVVAPHPEALGVGDREMDVLDGVAAQLGERDAEERR